MGVRRLAEIALPLRVGCCYPQLSRSKAVWAWKKTAVISYKYKEARAIGIMRGGKAGSVMKHLVGGQTRVQRVSVGWQGEWR